VQRLPTIEKYQLNVQEQHLQYCQLQTDLKFDLGIESNQCHLYLL